ncbi:hypothetical protein Pla52o_41280 [Novipirellula galeiformis]|uniref:DUF1573 domain-containing protein n=2 Tax=Novipirellula galeiformis TaxID=2528004 RepID=A0A5C6CAI7_9BACT|nr:DUF1573 domain-containing protein [Novipirellula galeiformis]TWU21095.1 hypothetical protein Pla52o_41280 [Novipirellula galeiformis]
MVRCSVLLASIVLFSVFSASAAPAQDWADKMFEVKTHDFRTVGRGTKSEFHFELTNKYEEDVHIAAVRSSCGCTTPTLTKETLKTHETGAVVATFNTSSFVGQKSATITVVFDKPFYAETQLKVSGFIRTDITFDPPEVAFGEFAAGDPQEREVVITHSGNSNWRITDVRSHCESLQVRLQPAELAPGVVRYRMRVKMKDSMDEGEIHERLTLISNDRAFPTTEMSISGRVRAAISVSPAAVNLGSNAPDAVIEKRLIVKGDEPFEVKDVLCSDDRFEFEIPVGSKKVHFIKVRFKGDGTEGSIAQKIRIVTDLAGDKSASCIVTGSLSNGK